MPNSLLLGLAFGTLAGLVLGALLTGLGGSRLVAAWRGRWGGWAARGRVRFELLEQ
jgi:hypothetical protein